MCGSMDERICREESCLNLTLTLNPKPVKPKKLPHSGSPILPQKRILRRAAVVAILASNCHPCSFNIIYFYLGLLKQA